MPGTFYATALGRDIYSDVWFSDNNWWFSSGETVEYGVNEFFIICAEKENESSSLTLFVITEESAGWTMVGK